MYLLFTLCTEFHGVPHEDQILPKLYAPHKRLGRPALDDLKQRSHVQRENRTDEIFTYWPLKYGICFS
jgi:hypothetical protein